MKKFIPFLLCIYCSLVISGCKKFLEEKPNAMLDIPATLTDFQALLDNYPVINTEDPSSGEVSADNYYLFDADYLALSSDTYSNMYTWQRADLFLPQTNDWFNCYQPVLTANTVLEGLGKLSPNAADQHDYNNVKGQALYARGRAFLLAAGLWTSAYAPGTAAAQLGVPLRLGSDFNQPSERGSLQQTYDQIISDLTAAAALLPVTPLQVLRPSRPAAYALLARTYLNMGQYEKAGLYADSSLSLYNTLIDFNTLDATVSYPLSRFNAEVIQESEMATLPPISNKRARIDTLLYGSYAPNDLRKTIFFRTSTNGSHVFRGSYEGASNLFGGIATDEVYLIRAECYARAGNTALAMADLNTLLINRFQAGTFVPLTAVNSNSALVMVLTERRKELLMRGLRWMDLKRLNVGGANITLTRIVNGQTYTLPPNDLRYALPIPDDIIQLTGIQQNPR